MDAVRQRFVDRILLALSEVSRPMEWGRDDCMLWVANILFDVTGVDPAKHWRSGYSELQAKERLGRRGILPVVLQCVREHGWKEIEPKSAQAGDVAIVKTSHKGRRVFSAMICRASGNGKTWFVGRNETGATMLESAHVHRAWSVA